MAEHVDLVIVGAGPAGMAAAVEARRGGLSVAVVDEGPAPGGQIYRNVLEGGARDGILGADYAAGRALAAAFLASGAAYCPEATAFLIERRTAGGFRLGLGRPGRPAGVLVGRAVLIAIGAQERPVPLPGWTLPGVMTAGAAQTLLKASGLVPEGPVVIAGSGPLIPLLVTQYARAGVPVSAVLDTTPAENLRAALPHLPAFLASGYALKGLRLLAAMQRAATVHRHVTGLGAEGDAALEAVRFTVRGRAMRLPARTLLLHQGVVPQISLAMAAGADHRWNAARRAFEPVLTADGETSLPGLHVAGDAGGIAGAAAAEAAGTIAAAAILRRLGGAPAEGAAREAAARRAFARALRGRACLDALFRPDDAVVRPADEVIVCRCEEVTAGTIRALVRRGAQGPNQIKAFCRAGMGPCQGRMCGLTVAELVAGERGISPAEVGHMRLRFPVKPVTVADFAALAEDGEG